MPQLNGKRIDSTSFLIGLVFVFSILGALLGAYKNKKGVLSKKIISENMPSNVVIVDPLSNQLLNASEILKKDFQLQYASTRSVVGWLSFVTDQGQPLSDQIAIGTSMASFLAGQPKTFPVVLQHPSMAKDYHMAFVLCDALGVEKIRPKIQEIERFLRIGAMGGKLPRSDCSTIHFRL